MAQTNGIDQKVTILKDLALTRLIEFHQSGDDITEKDITNARIASSNLSSCIKDEQRRVVQDGFKLRLGSELSRNKEELAEYIQRTLPQYSMPKALPEAKKA